MTDTVFGRQTAVCPEVPIKPVFTQILSGQSDSINLIFLSFISNFIFGMVSIEKVLSSKRDIIFSDFPFIKI